MTAARCPSVTIGSSELTHERCTAPACEWWHARCTAADTVPVARLIRRPRTRRLQCGIAAVCRWMRQADGGVCPPMQLGEICEHQGGTFNVFLLGATE